MEAGELEQAEEGPAPPAPERGIGPKTSLYLAEMAEKSFNRALDLDESVWRSLPFFAAGFGLALTMMAYLLNRLPQPQWSAYVVVTLIIVNLAMLSFLWSFHWFWRIIRRRSFRYPPDDWIVSDYADSANRFHADAGLDDAMRDDLTKLDLQDLVAAELAEATATNSKHANARLSARNQSLLFMMAGFALAFAAATIIFTKQSYWPDATRERVSTDESIRQDPAAQKAVGPPDTAAGKDRGARRDVLEVEDRSRDLRSSADTLDKSARPGIQRQ